ncbi:MCE family protein [bacterium SCSIO 12741]|nr:MCE family protein [bacterium SCSIO 12741]
MKFSKEIVIALVVLFSLGVFYFGYNFLKGSNLFNRGITLYATYEDVSGLNPDDPVTIQGDRVGKVRSYYLDPKSRQIILEIEFSRSELLIPDDSRAIIGSTGLLGGKVVLIELGNSNSYLVDEDTIASGTSVDVLESLTAGLEPFEKKAIEVVNSVDSVMKLMQLVLNDKNRGNIEDGLEHMADALETFDSAAVTLNDLLVSEKARLAIVMENLQVMSENLAEFSDTLNTLEIKQTIDQANTALASANEILRKVEEGEGTMGELVNNDTLYQNLEAASKNLDLLLIDLQNNPKRYVHFSVFGRKDKKDKNDSTKTN